MFKGVITLVEGSGWRFLRNQGNFFGFELLINITRSFLQKLVVVASKIRFKILSNWEKRTMGSAEYYCP